MKIILDITHYSYENAGFHTINLVENWVSELVNGVSRKFSDEDLRKHRIVKGSQRAKSLFFQTPLIKRDALLCHPMVR
jgi:hypothetical protein